MLINKYNPFRRVLYSFYRLFPPARLLKRASQPFKVRKLRRRIESRQRELAESMTVCGRHPLFNHVEIETFNRCNGECGFCPVNRHSDPRQAVRMSDSLFAAIIDQLQELDFHGHLFPFSNNEPLLDARIVDFTALAREKLPAATIFFYTNGVLLTPEKLRQLTPLVDYLTINNYCDDFTLAPNVREILDIADADPGLRHRVKVIMRYRRELMTSRGGQSPNKQDILSRTLKVGCPLPARQVVIRPDGKLSLCCNDALGKMTLGDLTRESLADIWWSERYVDIRNRVLEGRNALELCRRCDTLQS